MALKKELELLDTGSLSKSPSLVEQIDIVKEWWALIDPG